LKRSLGLWQRLKPGRYFLMAAFARKLGGSLALVAFCVWVGAVGEKHLHEVFAVGNRGGKDGREAAGLSGVGLCAVRKQQPHRLHILP